jgi:hypothetical protein
MLKDTRIHFTCHKSSELQGYYAAEAEILAIGTPYIAVLHLSAKIKVKNLYFSCCEIVMTPTDLYPSGLAV